MRLLLLILLLIPRIAFCDIHVEGGQIKITRDVLDKHYEETITLTDEGELEISENLKVKKNQKIKNWIMKVQEELNAPNPNLEEICRLLFKGIKFLYKMD